MAETGTAATLRSPPQQDRSRATVERIVAAADTVFADSGFHHASTTVIAQRAGVSVGALYRFFPDKERIALELVRRYLAAATERFGPILSEVAGPPDIPGAMARLIEATAELQLDHRGYYRLCEDFNPKLEGSPAHPAREALMDQFERAFDTLDEHLVPAARRRHVIELCIETVRHTLARCPHDSPERPTMIRELTTMVTAYITADIGPA